MKAIKTLLAVILVSGILISTGCKKYEEGPVVSLRSKKERVINDWLLKEEYKNGAKQDNSNTTIELEIKDDGSVIKTTTFSYTVFGETQTTTITNYYNWEFNSDKTKLILTVSNEDGENYSYGESYTIVKLYENEMWLKYIDGDDEYEYHYEPK